MVRLAAPLLGEQRAEPEPARLGEVVVQVVDLDVEDELVAGDHGARGGEVAGGVGVQQIAATRAPAGAAARTWRHKSGA